jgi:hypothetical protein
MNVMAPRPSVPLSNSPEDTYIIFARNHLDPNGPMDAALRELQAIGLTRYGATPPRVESQKAHLQAVLSFATIFFGRQNNYFAIAQDGYVRHGATLQQLNRALSAPDCHTSDDIIVSVITLAVQEMLVPTGSGLFLNHILGLEKFLALRDPQVYCSPRSVGLYKCLRHMLLFAALSSGRSTILAKPQWKAVLMQSCENEEESMEQQLYDVLADCSVLMVELRRIQGDEDARVKHLREAVELLREQLRDWRLRWDADESNAPLELCTFPQPGIVPQPTDLVFPKTRSALRLILYNAALLYVLHILSSLPDQQHFRKDYAAASHSAILEICRSIPSTSDMQSCAAMHGSPVVYIAVDIACKVLRGNDTGEGRMLVGMLSRKSTGVVEGS